ncbi:MULTISPECIES: response regulator transcription factor [Shewanella]|uniref:response regulator transcription factor n=1 Tax=Shewanella TaxID=22 RepID=UPI0011830130|nr:MULTISPECIES: response regulator transcription factor [Shewanella]QYJ91239.1 response regulator transcription factor [Shewanella halotolerans]QYJ92653.1 response regulator transcription factor [Shewanella spartinae]QYK11785.1 response regulator transcription factor [Shewanella rhizosphaerae]TVP15143.1 DNA-binding response regulator [Shewanella sp. KCT]
MLQPLKIIIADDHPLFRQALVNTLTTQFDQPMLFEAETVTALDEILTQHQDADLLLLDLNIPNAHGFNTLVNIRNSYPHIGIVVISGQEDKVTVGKAMSFGAAGFIPKSSPVEQMVKAINAVMAGRQWMPPGCEDLSAVTLDSMSSKIASLSPRQHKILMMFADGLLNKQIAYELGLSEATIKAHASAIFLKLGVHTRTQAVIAMSQLYLDKTPLTAEVEEV